MRKFLLSIICVFAVFSAFGAGENVPTSKSYIDSVLVDKQDTIERTTGNNQALTNTGTAGGYGTKDIYDSAASYAEQTDALIDAATMNAAVQNAINAEFVCISWVDDDPSKDCLLMEIRSATERRSPNLFDISKIPAQVTTVNTEIINNGDGSIFVASLVEGGNSAIATRKTLKELAPDLVPNKTYILSFNTTGKMSDTLFHCYGHTNDNWRWASGQSKNITENMLDCMMFFYASGSNTSANISNIQITEGTTVQPYQPYGNIYLPAGN